MFGHRTPLEAGLSSAPESRHQRHRLQQTNSRSSRRRSSHTSRGEKKSETQVQQANPRSTKEVFALLKK
jgi:hypothetical protein